MMKPKVALVKDGFLPAGSENKRGRLSADAINRCKELAAKGWQIEGYEVSKTEKSADAPKVEKVKVSTGAKEIADIGNPLRDESVWEAYGNHNGEVKPIGMRTVCNTCHCSLTYCPCKSPVVWIDYDAAVVVNFKPRR